ncbi:hypothetical protein VOLCADRAFT_104506 [Volvox carteri f. nagariensis]|uniref:Uncharacterized protein n=1 Tax=Volvox carteri f. nagariensis TaxID=3068 RepID=D8TU29_VOLCA|nr:uncharacterized protein VOLCADRAFT_104506 [Volvox carteri f. nagariensis]EFJ49070.1 hypothetical protein VOLCADRAFT_104506 [Volvox carteri f. nagariensis]|eukprot:XP_002949967.1 hypothetical protein VOLCADRAFT_104506 [Volvox carteri f. nagariensis]
MLVAIARIPAAAVGMPYGPAADTVHSSAVGAAVWSHAARTAVRHRHTQRLSPCRATLDTPEISELVQKMLAARPPPTDRENLSKCLSLIEEINAKDPSKVEYGGQRYPYRVLFGTWLAGWVEKLDPGAPDELFILARGYIEASQKLVEDFMLNRDLPDPRDVRLYDVTGPMGIINFRLLELLLMVQTLRDAEALVFLEHTFPRMFEELPADEVLTAVKRELVGVSKKCLATALQLPWSPLQRKLLGRALPAPPGLGGVLRELEGVAAASTHPGDWRYRDFDYE